jgi:hypothetical protein
MVYMVERSLPGISSEQLADAQQAAIRTADQFSRQGTPVRYLRSTFIPAESRCFCLFEASSDEAVKQVNDAAGLPYSRIVEALHLPRPDAV